jgi:hypothetical protein
MILQALILLPEPIRAVHPRKGATRQPDSLHRLLVVREILNHVSPGVRHVANSDDRRLRLSVAKFFFERSASGCSKREDTLQRLEHVASILAYCRLQETGKVLFQSDRARPVTRDRSGTQRSNDSDLSMVAGAGHRNVTKRIFNRSKLHGQFCDLISFVLSRAEDSSS